MAPKRSQKRKASAALKSPTPATSSPPTKKARTEANAEAPGPSQPTVSLPPPPENNEHPEPLRDPSMSQSELQEVGGLLTRWLGYLPEAEIDKPDCVLGRYDDLAEYLATLPSAYEELQDAFDMVHTDSGKIPRSRIPPIISDSSSDSNPTYENEDLEIFLL